MPLSGVHTHEALFYRDDREYLEGISRFLESAREAGEPAALALPEPKHESVRGILAGLGDCELHDMSEVGRNPGRLIAMIGRLLDEHDRRTLYFVGEPVWPGRGADEVREALRHESLINLAFRDTFVRVLCPYDAAHLDPSVLASAERTHHSVLDRGYSRICPSYSDAIPPECEESLEPPPGNALRFELQDGDLASIRAAVREFGRNQHVPAAALADLLIVANELATNAYEHGAPPRRLTLWRGLRHLICQVENEGAIADPLAGRRNPQHKPGHGMGLWIVHEISELVEMCDGGRTTIRAHLAAGTA